MIKEIIKFYIILSLLFCLCIIILFYNNKNNINSDGIVVKVVGNSMEPTYNDGQEIEYHKIDSSINLNVNDIVVFKYDNLLVLKRIIAVGNDTITISDNDIFVNNKYINHLNRTNEYIYNYEYLLNENELFVIGDNINNSIDSVEIGCIYKENIVGLVKECVYD